MTFPGIYLSIKFSSRRARCYSFVIEPNVASYQTQHFESSDTPISYTCYGIAGISCRSKWIKLDTSSENETLETLISALNEIEFRLTSRTGKYLRTCSKIFVIVIACRIPITVCISETHASSPLRGTYSRVVVTIAVTIYELCFVLSKTLRKIGLCHRL